MSGSRISVAAVEEAGQPEIRSRRLPRWQHLPHTDPYAAERMEIPFAVES